MSKELQKYHEGVAQGYAYAADYLSSMSTSKDPDDLKKIALFFLDRCKANLEDAIKHAEAGK